MDMSGTLSFVAGLVLLGAIGCGMGPGETSVSAGGSAGTAGTGGTAGSSGSTASGGAGGSGGVSVCPDDPADGPVSEECGIWVSGFLGSDANPGTQADPVATLQRAFDIAVQNGKGHVYACG